MISKFFIGIFGLFKGIIASPIRMFKDLEKGEYDYSVYSMFLLSALITFSKSFQKESQTFNFYSNEIFNEVMSFLSIPQVQWLVSFMCFILLILLVKIFCCFLLKKCDKRRLILCFLSISSVGVFLQTFFSPLLLFLPQASIRALNIGVFLWVVILSVIAIKNSQNASWVQSIIIYTLSAIPIVLITGLTGLAPFLLFLR